MSIGVIVSNPNKDSEMNDNKVVDLNQHHNKKLIQIEQDIRETNYGVIRLFPRFDNDTHMEKLYAFEEMTQLAFMNKYEKGIDPCYCFFSVFGCADIASSFLHSLFIKSTLSSYEKRTGPGRDEIKLDDGSIFSKLPVIGALRHFNHPSQHHGEMVKFTDIRETVSTGEGSLYFFSLFVTLLGVYLDAGKSSFIPTSLTTRAVKNDMFNTDSLIEITFDNGKEHLVLSIDVDLCNKEVHDYRVRMTTEG